MARTIDGKEYITLREWLNGSGSLPKEFSALPIPTLTAPGSVTFADLFNDRFNHRYLFTSDLDEFRRKLQNSAFVSMSTLKTKIDNLAQLEVDFMADSEEETTDTLRSPSGTLQTGGFSSGGVIVKRSGGASGDTDRLIRYQNERVEILSKALDMFEPLFMAVHSEWGDEV